MEQNKYTFVEEEQEEEYQTLLRTVTWKEGFSLFFVECLPDKADKIIERFKVDAIDKNIEVLSFSKPIENLFDIVNGLPNKNDIDILFLTGLEISLNDHIKEGYDGQGNYYNLNSVPTLLGHLNYRRDSFRDHFNIRFVFLLPKFAIKYFTRRAPDFYDWLSGDYSFSDIDNLLEELFPQFKETSIKNLPYEVFKETSIKNLPYEVTQSKLLGIKALINNENYCQCSEIKANLHLKEGLLLYSMEQYRQAVLSYEKAIEINPHNSKFWGYHSLALLYSERTEEAISSCDKSLEIDSYNTQVWFIKAIALLILGRLEVALENIDKALQLKANNYQFWYFRGFIYEKLQKYQEAIECYRRPVQRMLNLEK
jgi:tetratricopeptide (TPR) repeat protein